MRKNIVHYVTRQYMKRNKKRTLTTFLGIVCMVLLMTCVFVGKNTGIAFLQYVSSLKDGKWHMSLYGTDQESLENIRDLDYVEETALSLDYGYADFPGSQNKDRPYLYIKAYQEPCFDWMNIELAEGRLPKSSKEIVLSQSALTDGAEVGVGDTISASFFARSITGNNPEVESTVFPFFGITLKYGETVEVPQNFPYYGDTDSFLDNKQYTGKTMDYQVVGIINAPSYETESQAGYTALTYLDEAEAISLGTFNLTMCFDLDKLPAMYSLEIEDMAHYTETEINDYVMAYSFGSSDATVNRVIRFMMIFFVLLIMMASAVLIYNVFNISYRERARYLGMLSSVGATGRQKRSSIYYEAFSLLLPALPAGILAGMGVVKVGIMALRPLLGKFMDMESYVKDAPVSLVVSWKEIAAVAAVSTITVFISAFWPARKIGKTGAIASIRGNEGKRQRQYVMKLSGAKGMAGERMLAKNTVKRQKKKTKSIVGALSTFLVIMTVTVFGANIVTDMIKLRILDDNGIGVNLERWDYGFGILAEDDIGQYEAIKEEIQKNPGALDVTEMYDGYFAGQVHGEAYSREYEEAAHEIFNLAYHRDLSQEEFETLSGWDNHNMVCIQGVSDEIFREIAEKAGADMELLEEQEKDTCIVVREGELSTESWRIEGHEPDGFRYFGIENMTDLKQGETMDVSLYNYKTEEDILFPMQIAGFADWEDMEEYIHIKDMYLWIIVPNDICVEMNEKAGMVLDPTVYFKWDGEESFLDEIRNACQETKSQSMNLFELNYARTFGEAIIDIVHVLAVCFAAAASGICLLNLFNSIRGRLAERQGEFGVLRSVGMTGKQMRKMLSLENIRLLARSVAYAAVISAGILWLLQKAVVDMFGRIQFTVPWGWLAAAVALAGAALWGITQRCFYKEEGNLLEHAIDGSV